MNHYPQIRRRYRRLLGILSSRRGAIDLPSIMIGVAVVAILSIGVTATVFGAIPWAQNHSAKQGVAAVRTAEGLAANSHGSFLDTAALKKAGYLEKAEGLGIVTNGRAGDKGCFVAVMQSKSGKMYYGSDTMAEPEELKDGTKTPCILGAQLQDAIDEAGGKVVAGKDTYSISKTGGTGQRNTNIPDTFTATHAVVPGLEGKTITEIASGTHHVCVIANNEPWCWGLQASYRLGNKIQSEETATPVKASTAKLPAGAKLHSLTSSYATTCLIADGHPYCWGNNYNGQIDVTKHSDDANNVAEPTLVPVMGSKKVSSITSGYWNTCAISDGELWCWGQNRDGVNGNGVIDGADGTFQAPKKVGGALAGKTVTYAMAGRYNTCAVADETLYCWGAAQRGQLTARSTTSGVPVKIAGLPKGAVKQVGIGGVHICALVDTNVWCWGGSPRGEVGNGGTADVKKPHLVKGVLQGKAVESVQLSYSYSCALADGEAYCWGEGTYGQTGLGVTADAKMPVKVTVPGTGKAVLLGAGQVSSAVVTAQR